MGEYTVSAQILAAIEAMPALELLAVVLALAYLLLAMMERIECWYAAFISTAIYIFLFWDVNLLMESALQIYYLAIAVYGWWQWRRANDGNGGPSEQELVIHTWSVRRHLSVFSVLAVLVLVSGYLLAQNTTAALPYLDSFTTWGAVITTYMVTRKVLENWLYWIVIDGVSVYLYIDRGLYLTAVLFVLYVIIVIIGFFQWLPRYRQQQVDAGAIAGTVRSLPGRWQGEYESFCTDKHSAGLACLGRSTTAPGQAPGRRFNQRQLSAAGAGPALCVADQCREQRCPRSGPRQ